MLVRFVLPAVAAALLTVAVIHIDRAGREAPRIGPPALPARSPFANTIAGVGSLEPESEAVEVGTHESGVVKAVHVRVNDRVAAGGLLFELDDRLLTAELAVREATRDGASAQIARLDALPRAEEVPPLAERVAEARATLEGKEKLLELAKQEAAGGVGFTESFDVRKTAVDVARAQLRRAQADLDLASAGAWAHDRAVARVALTQAQSQCAQARVALERLRVTAPRVRRSTAPAAQGPAREEDAVEFCVLQVNIRPGESVGGANTRPAVVLGAVGVLHVRVEVDETDIPRFRPGVAAVASPRGHSGKAYPLAFVRVEPCVRPKRSLTGDSVERVDTRVLQVLYTIPADQALYVGQQFDVFLDAGDSNR
jgi:HlyD family secretion protein